MNTDCAFYIGSTHNICQDFCLNNNNSIVISDGCSGSPNTDIGSRVLSITAMNRLQELKTLRDFNEPECICLARSAIKILDIPNECLDATLFFATSYKETLQVRGYGDGVIVIKTKTGNTYIINCTYTDNYPYYMNYIYDKKGRDKEWYTNHNKKENTVSVIKANGDIKIISSDLDIKEVRLLDIGVVFGGGHNVLVDIVNTKDIDHISIMSDGVHSFYETITTETSRHNKSVSYIEVIKELLNFKNYNNSFVQRRINKFRKDCKKNKWANSDDVSLATIHVGE